MIKYGSFVEKGLTFVAYIPSEEVEELAWQVKISKDDQEINTLTIPMQHEPIFGPDLEDVQELEYEIDRYLSTVKE